MTASQAYRNILVIGALILGGYVFVTTGNPVQLKSEDDAFDEKDLDSKLKISDEKHFISSTADIQSESSIKEQQLTKDNNPWMRSETEKLKSSQVKRSLEGQLDKSLKVQKSDKKENDFNSLKEQKSDEKGDDFKSSKVQKSDEKEDDFKSSKVQKSDDKGDDFKSSKVQKSDDKGDEFKFSKALKSDEKGKDFKLSRVKKSNNDVEIFNQGNIERKEEPQEKSNEKDSGDESKNVDLKLDSNNPQRHLPVQLKKRPRETPEEGESPDKKRHELISANKQPKKLKRLSKLTRRRLIRKKIKAKIAEAQNLSTEEKNLYQQQLERTFGSDYHASEDYKRIVDKCSQYKRYKGRILFFDSSPYLETQSNLCNGKLDILIAVHTRPTNFKRRELIRNTYGSMRYIRGKRIGLAFFIGTTSNDDVTKMIREEAVHYGDVVQRDYVENYRNMTYKHLTIMNWVMDYCPSAEYLVKVDDDVFVNIFQVVDYIETFQPQTFYCTKTVGPKPQRKRGKWKLSYDEYSRSTFPPYCMGYAYIMKASLARDMYWCSVYSKFLWIDDVLVGGLLPEKLGIELVKFISGHNSAYLLPSHGSWKVADHMFLLGTRNELLPSDVRKIWRSALQYSY